MPEAVVDSLEVVDVDQAERQRQPALTSLRELALEPLVEVAVIAKPGQRIRQRQPHRAESPNDRALVELDREQRPNKRDREERRALPEHDEHQRRRRHQRERHDRPAHVGARERQQGATRADRHDGGDQDQVDAVLSRGRCANAGEHPACLCRIPERRRERSGRGSRQRQDRDVVGDADLRALLEELGGGGRQNDDEQARGPPEEHDRRDAEHEGQRHARRPDPFDRNREAVGQHRREDQCAQPQQRRRLVRSNRERDDRGARDEGGGAFPEVANVELQPDQQEQRGVQQEGDHLPEQQQPLA